ncbi:MAG: sodium-translocating pyrophosphatase [Actinomycetota bacterium]|nr:sodium-translocating pyrophosphatase [Actinomycetota bacterium]
MPVLAQIGDNGDTVVPLLGVAAALGGLGLALYFSSVVHRADEGTAIMREIAAAIREGAMAFIRREYRWVAVFVGGMALLIFALLPYGRPWGAIAYLVGAGFSASAGFIGLRIATAANSRTANAARLGAVQALPLAFRGGAVMGFTVAGLGLGGIALAYLVFHVLLEVQDAFQVIAAFALGASSIALFARIGGGIYTKAADIGADLVGKVEADIPEDDPRNPATIADNVGDNVGDVAGMGADLFESYAGSLVAPIVLAGLVFADAPADLQRASFLFPLLVGALGMAASILGALAVRGRRGTRLAKQLHRGTNLAAVLTILGTIGAAYWLFGGEVRPLHLAGTVIAGLVAGMALGFTSEYYTSSHYRPVRQLAGQSETGAATVVIAGVAEGMLSTIASVLLLVGAIGLAFYLGEQAMPTIQDSGLYGVALAAIGMLATTGVVVAVDAYGPIADNAGGIAEMAHLPPEVREVTDSLDTLGNTTAAIAKGFAIGSAAITALALFKSFTAAAALEAIDIQNVDVTIGLFLGAMVPFAFAALTMKAVGRAAQRMIQEVRRQFAEIPGLRAGLRGARPDYARCVDISTRAALRQMVAPGALAVVLPLLLGFMSVEALGGFLAGALVTGFLLAIFMANAGGAWDNAKKFIEAGNLGGKGSDPHKAAVVGDTVGDPFKDTSGPAMNILIKVMTIVALVFAPAFIA